MNTADQHIIIGSDATATVTFTDQDGGAADPTDAVTAKIISSDGTILVAAGTATTKTGEGTYEVAIPVAGTAQLDVLTATWTAGARTRVTRIEIVGGYYLGLDQLRGLANLGNVAKYPNQKLIDARRWFETTFERYTGRAFVPRFRQVTVWGDGSDQIQLPDEYIRHIRRLTIGGTVLTDAQIASLETLGSGIVRRPVPDPFYGQYPTMLTNGWPVQLFPARRVVTAAYEYGLDEPPEDIRRAGRVAIQAELLSDNIAGRELSVSTEVGLVRMSYPGPDRPFGIPFVDEVANAYQRDDRDNGNTLTVGSVPIG